MTTTLVYGKAVLCDAATEIPNGAVLVRDDVIAAVGDYGELTRTHADEIDRTVGSAEMLVTPGFVNAHGHGKGITDFQLGHVDNTLETWKFRSYPGDYDHTWDTIWTGMQLLRSGVTASMHNHTLLDPAEPEAEFDATIAAYGRTGIRVAFAPLLTTSDNVFVYGDNDAFVASLPEPVRDLARGIRRRSTALSLERYLAAVAHLCRRHAADPRVHIMHGPLAPQWVDDEALTALKADARDKNIPIHIHVQQTRLQKLYAFKTYGKTLLAHMDDIGFLGPEVTCGHCVWVTAEDIDLLAGRGCGVTNHVSCNLRVRNGICPAHALVRRGVPVAIGIDDKGLADSRDFIEEMRLVSKLNRNPSHRLDSDHLTTADVFTMGTVNGARALGWEGRSGRIAEGLQADLTLVDLSRIRAPFTWSGHRMTDLLLYRGRATDVDTVMVGGEILLENGRFTQLDPEEVFARLRESMPADYDRRWVENNRLAPELRRHITDWFAPWFEELEAEPPDPFFYLNGRR